MTQPDPDVEASERGMDTHDGPTGGDAVDEFEHRGWRFLCSGERLPGGGFHAVVRCRMPPSGSIRTLRLGQERLDSASVARDLSRMMAMQWVDEHLESGQAP